MPPLFCVDAFSDAPFSGNPAGVCLLDKPANARWMQQMGAEMALSETAFIIPSARGMDLRWFTPKTEVDLCGHATLAGAHVLWESGITAPDKDIRFYTRSGILSARREDGLILLDFPSLPPELCPVPETLSDALGTAVSECHRNRLDRLVVVSDEDELKSLDPDFEALGAIDARGVIVTALCTSPGFDFVSRYFAPAVGINEDPVTGSAHCALGPFWAKRLGRDTLIGYQASERGGTVGVRVRGNRVDLSGQAVTIWKGAITTTAAPR